MCTHSSRYRRIAIAWSEQSRPTDCTTSQSRRSPWATAPVRWICGSDRPRREPTLVRRPSFARAPATSRSPCARSTTGPCRPASSAWTSSSSTWKVPSSWCSPVANSSSPVFARSYSPNSPSTGYPRRGARRPTFHAGPWITTTGCSRGTGTSDASFRRIPRVWKTRCWCRSSGGRTKGHETLVSCPPSFSHAPPAYGAPARRLQSSQQRVVVGCAGNPLDQPLHARLGRHLLEAAAQRVDRVELPHLVELLLPARAGTRHVERREDALLGERAVELDLAVAGALELLEDHVVHA